MDRYILNLKIVLKTLYMSAFMPLTRYCLRKKCEATTNIEELVDLSFNLHKGFLPSRIGYALISIRPSQIRSELITLLTILSKVKPKGILEIGTYKGGSLFCFTRVASEDATIVSVDLPGRFLLSSYPYLRVYLYRSFGLKSQKIWLLRSDSHKTETLDKVKQIFGGEQLDFLFIDGDHSYQGVKKDFEMYSGLVKKGGLIAFHDICSGPASNVGEVPIFWKEIKDRYPHQEIVDNWSQGAAGIGLIYA